ncbi:3-keto-disaccharide hydrolase [Mariniflexile sp.]|uniref:3-keto-disaccharide hydrolase n=1 Tax=Mariniflexile sp. TaxID=1979402 RepID=UPI00404710DE
MKKLIICLLSGFVFMSCLGQKKEAVESITEEPTKPEATEVWEPIPPTVIPGNNNEPPSDAIVLFNGKNFNEWVSIKDSSSVKWILNKDGSMTVKGKTGNIQTKRNFGNVQLHIEWKSPEDDEGIGQQRGNSGVFLQGRYEVQVLDNNDNDTYANGQVGSIYKQSIPLAKASYPTGKWNTYDIIYHTPKFDTDGEKTKSAYITLLHNGILILDHYEIKGTTEYIGWPKNVPHGKAPIMLQDHGDAVSYRNIWVREL